RWIYLHGTYEELHNRMTQRKGHFMPARLLESQFETLEPPAYGIHIPVALPPDQALRKILDELGGLSP
ncbi:MAG: gluconokinase, partial [Robiginitalea sp.]|nr:gluconokinase [Robiginitalea sp.]